MPKLFPGMIFAIFSGIPGLWLAVWFSSPRVQKRPFAEFIALLTRATPPLFLLYGSFTLIYGTLAWLILRRLDCLDLPAFLIAAALPVLCYWTWGLVNYGWEPLALWGLRTWLIPALINGAALWWFTVAGHS